MPGFDGFLDLRPRSPKPRSSGLTHVIDKGLNLREIEGLFDTAGDYVDIVKLGWGTSYVTNNLEKKIALYRSFDTPVVCGGTLFEAVVARGKLDEYKRWLQALGIEHVEISDGTVEIAAIAREAGHRTKIAVRSTAPGVNAKGACIGPMGQRVRAVMSELHGEKIDIIDWSDDPATFVGNALSPAKVTSVTVVDPNLRAARVVVPDYQLSLAIGREGQNARLAARLTGWRIDIRSDTAPEPVESSPAGNG